jgi:hypothetical protein
MRKVRRFEHFCFFAHQQTRICRSRIGLSVNSLTQYQLCATHRYGSDLVGFSNLAVVQP